MPRVVPANQAGQDDAESPDVGRLSRVRFTLGVGVDAFCGG